MPRRISCVRLTEEAGEQRNEYDADQGYAAARHELFHTLAFRTRVIIAITFKQVDCAPDAKTGSESDNESLKNIDSRVKECHNLYLRKI